MVNGLVLYLYLLLTMELSNKFTLFCVFASIFLLGRVSAQESCPKEDHVIFCYYESWAIYRPSYGFFNISNIDTDLCTHFVYSFAGVGIDGIVIPLDPANDLPGSGRFEQYYHFRMLKEMNPCIKVILSIGGWNEGSEKYSVMAETAESRATFADHLLRFIVFYGFDGIDFDWEYPAQRGGIGIDKQNYVALLGELKKRLTPRNKLLSVAVGAATKLTEESYDVRSIAELVDYVLLMTYDYHQQNYTSFMAPLRRVDGDSNSGSVTESVKKWLDLGCPASKLVLGIQTTGRSYTLAAPNLDSSKNGIGMLAKGPGKRGPFTQIEGFFAYYEICEITAEEKWHVVSNDGIYASSYATKGDQWASFEDESTVFLKSKYVVEQKLAGVLVWTLDTDDFVSFCGEYPNILLRTMNSGLGRKF